MRYKQNWTPLHIAARENKLHVARLLVQRGGDLGARNAHGKTPLELAGSDEMRDLLAQLGRDEARCGAEQAAAPARAEAPLEGVAARRKAAEEADTRRREALEEADLARALGNRTPTQSRAAVHTDAAQTPAELAGLAARVAAKLRQAQQAVAASRLEGRGEAVRAPPPVSWVAGAIPSLLAPARGSTAAAVGLATTESARHRVLAAKGPPAQPGSPSLAAGRRELLSPDEAQRRSAAAAAAAAAPPPLHELQRLRREAEQAHHAKGPPSERAWPQRMATAQMVSVTPQPAAPRPANVQDEAALVQRLGALSSGGPSEAPAPRPWEPAQEAEAPSLPQPPKSSLATFLSFLFGEDDPADSAPTTEGSKARSRVCCAIGGGLHPVPSLLLDEDR